MSSKISSQIKYFIIKVGTANFTILKSNKKIILIDCGYNVGHWISKGELIVSKYNFNDKILENVNEVLAIISHNEQDHKRLIYNLIQFYMEKKIKKITVINKENNILRVEKINKGINEVYEEKCETEIKNENIRNILNEIEHYIENCNIYLFIPVFGKICIKNNDLSIVIKLEINIKDEKYGFLITGDATYKTLNAIEKGRIIIWGNEDYLLEGIKNLFINIICYIVPHHGSLINKENVWTEKVMKFSKYVVLTIISSDPYHNYNIPKMDSLKEIINLIKINLNNNKNKMFICKPHVIDCYNEKIKIKEINNNKRKYIEDDYEDEKNILCKNFNVINYPSIIDGNIIPLFITCNVKHFMYEVIIDDESITLLDTNSELSNNEMIYKMLLDNNEEKNMEIKTKQNFYKALMYIFLIELIIEIDKILSEMDDIKIKVNNDIYMSKEKNYIERLIKLLYSHNMIYIIKNEMKNNKNIFVELLDNIQKDENYKIVKEMENEYEYISILFNKTELKNILKNSIKLEERTKEYLGEFEPLKFDNVIKKNIENLCYKLEYLEI